MSPALRTVGALSSSGYVEYNGLLIKFQRRFANHFSFLNSYTLGQRHRPELGQRRHRHADQHLRPRLQPRAGRLRRHAHVQLQLDLRAAVGAQSGSGGWQVSGILYRAQRPAAQDHAVAEHAVDGHHQQPAEHDLRPGARATRRSTAGSTPRASSRSPTRPARSATPARNTVRGPGDFNIDVSLIKNDDSATSTPSCASRRSTCSTTRRSRTRTRSSATRRSAPSRRCSPAVVRDLRHHRAPDPAGGEGKVLRRREAARTHEDTTDNVGP